MIDVYLNQPNMKDPEDGIYYLAAANGCFKVVHNPYYKVVVKVEKSPVEKLEPGLKVYTPKLPYEILRQAEQFFAAVYAKYKSEAIMLLALSMEDKKWVPIIPEQTTRGLHVDYVIPTTLNLPEHYKLFGSIHSHAGAPSFHSGTDDKDELYSDGFHVVIGSFDKDTHDMCCRFVVQGVVFKAELKDWLEMPAGEFDASWLNKVSEKTYPQTNTSTGGWWDDDDFGYPIDRKRIETKTARTHNASIRAELDGVIARAKDHLSFCRSIETPDFVESIKMDGIESLIEDLTASA